jgi:alkylation response protein AidB-like acyl-CoA dehydrogenase
VRTASLNKPAVHPAGFFVSETPDFAALTARIAARAAALDLAVQFPAEDIADLAQSGLLLAPAPRLAGGLGWGSEAGGGPALLRLLRAIGAGNLAVGRLYEAHINALALIAAYGAPDLVARAAQDASQGHLFGLWVTDGAAPLLFADGVLQGGKAVCSAAGHITRALVTASRPDGGAQLCIVALPAGERAAAATITLTGMRAAVTGSMDLSGLRAEAVGAAGDYLREPLFSAGAWRTSAVTLGGLDALVACVGGELLARGRDANPHQRARFGQLLIARETAALWMARAAVIAEARTEPAPTIAGYVNLARLAVEQAVFEALTLTQRSLGLSAFMVGRPVERIMRDLATYLRQPAADEALAEAAAWFIDPEHAT